MQKYNIVSEWMNVAVSEKTRTFIQAFVDGAAHDSGIILQPGDVVRWRLTSNGRIAFAVFRPEQAELPKARSKAPVAPPVASPVELPAGITPEVLAQALAIAASKTPIAGEQPVPFITPEMLPQLLAMIEDNKAKGKAKRKA